MKTTMELRNELANGTIAEERYSARIWIADTLFTGNTIDDLQAFVDNAKTLRVTAHLNSVASFRESQMSRAMGIANGAYTAAINQIVLRNALTFKVETNTKEEKIQAAKLAEQAAEAVYLQAVTYGISCDNEVLFPTLASAGQTKKAHCYGFSAETLRKYPKLFTCGGVSWNTFGKLAESKRQQYMALIATGSAPASRYGFNWTADDMIIIDDVDVTINGNFRKCDMTKGYAISDVDNVTVKQTDGAILVVDEAFRGLAAQARSFGGKGMMYFSDIAYAEKQGYELKVDDIWGKTHDIKAEGVKIIAFKSAMKTASLFSSLDAFRAHCKQAAAEGFNEVAFCAAPKSKNNLETKTLGRQLVQTLRGITKDQIISIAKPQLDKLAELETIEGLKKTLAGQNNNVGLLANTLPGFEQTTLAYTIGKELFDSQFKDAANCRIGKAVFEFIVPDDIAIQDVIFGHKDPSKEQVGVLEANTVALKNLKVANGTEAVMGRYPCNGDKLRVVTIVHNANTKWFSTNCQYCSFNDANVYFVDGDFDGDESVITTDTIVVELVKKLNAEIKPVIHELGNTPTMARPVSDAKEMRKFVVKARVFGYLHGNVGSVANTITKSFAYDGDINHIAALATQHQAVIDSTKTYVAARPVSKDVTEALWDNGQAKPMPWCQRFNKSVDTEIVDRELVKHAWDDEAYWATKNIAAQPVDCVIDNVPVAIIEDRNGGHYSANWARVEAEWKLCTKSSTIVRTVKVNADIAEELRKKYENDEFAAKWLNEMDNSSVVPFDVFFSYVISNIKNSTLFNNNDNEEDAEEANDKYAQIRKVMRVAAEGTEEERDQAILNTLVLDYFIRNDRTAELTSSWKGAHWFQRNVIEVYGDLMARNCEINLADEALTYAEAEANGETVEIF